MPVREKDAIQISVQVKYVKNGGAGAGAETRYVVEDGLTKVSQALQDLSSSVAQEAKIKEKWYGSELQSIESTLKTMIINSTLSKEKTEELKQVCRDMETENFLDEIKKGQTVVRNCEPEISCFCIKNPSPVSTRELNDLDISLANFNQKIVKALEENKKQTPKPKLPITPEKIQSNPVGGSITPEKIQREKKESSSSQGESSNPKQEPDSKFQRQHVEDHPRNLNQSIPGLPLNNKTDPNLTEMRQLHRKEEKQYGLPLSNTTYSVPSPSPKPPEVEDHHRIHNHSIPATYSVPTPSPQLKENYKQPGGKIEYSNPTEKNGKNLNTTAASSMPAAPLVSSAPREFGDIALAKEPRQAEKNQGVQDHKNKWAGGSYQIS